jgi:hypothetical protein
VTIEVLQDDGTVTLHGTTTEPRTMARMVRLMELGNVKFDVRVERRGPGKWEFWVECLALD